jgi:hypothetical protein
MCRPVKFLPFLVDVCGRYFSSTQSRSGIGRGGGIRGSILLLGNMSFVTGIAFAYKLCKRLYSRQWNINRERFKDGGEINIL